MNDSLVQDEIVTVSSGNIQRYEYISEEIYGNKYVVTLKATVSISKLIKYTESKGYKAEFAGNVFAQNVKIKEFYRINEAKVLFHLYQQVFAIMPYMLDYKISVSSPEYKYDSKKQRNSWMIPTSITLSPNENANKILDLLINTLNSISIPTEEREDYKKMGFNITNIHLFKTSGEYQYSWAFRDRRAIGEFLEALKFEAYHQINAFKILDNFGEYKIDLDKFTHLYRVFYNKDGNSYYSGVESDKYIEQLLPERFVRISYSFSYHDLSESLHRVLTKRTNIKIILRYDSLNEIKQLTKFQIEPTHKIMEYDVK